MSDINTAVEINTANIKPIYFNKNFLLLMLANAVSFMGDGIHFMALRLFIIDNIGTGKSVSLIMICSSLPSILLSPFTGVLADRLDRRKIMILMDIIRGIIAVTLGYLVFIDKAYMWTLYAGTILLSICSSIYYPASGALFPNLVNRTQLLKANSVSAFLSNSTAVVGPVVAAIIYGGLGAKASFAINGLTFVFAAACKLFIVAPEASKQLGTKSKSFFTNLVDGFRYVIKTKALLAMLLFGATVNFFFFPVQDIIQPLLLKKDLLFSNNSFGIVTAFFPGAMIVVTILLQFIPQPQKKHKLFLWSMFAQSMGLILFVIPILPFIKDKINISDFFLIYCIITSLRGFAFGLTNIPMTTVYQTLTKDEYRGRVLSLQGTFIGGLKPIAWAIGGILVDTVPIYWICIVAGICMGLATLYMFKVDGIKEV